MIPWLPFFNWSEKQRRLRRPTIKIQNGEIHVAIPYDKPPSSGSTSRTSNGPRIQVSPAHGAIKSRSPRATPSPRTTQTPKPASRPSSARKSPTTVPQQEVQRKSPAPHTEPPVQPKPPKMKKGFETSQAMLDLFGYSSTGPSSCFETIPPPKEEKHYGRKNLLQKELNQPTEWEEVKNLQSITASCFQVKR